jgi:NhaP-type Na+/H+ or K+/H+ antiporter
VGNRPADGDHRVRNAILGGVIGGAAGLLTCAAISNAIEDPGTGFSTCTSKGSAVSGLGGFSIGAIIGWLVGRTPVRSESN